MTSPLGFRQTPAQPSHALLMFVSRFHRRQEVQKFPRSMVVTELVIVHGLLRLPQPFVGNFRPQSRAQDPNAANDKRIPFHEIKIALLRAHMFLQLQLLHHDALQSGGVVILVIARQVQDALEAVGLSKKKRTQSLGAGESDASIGARGSMMETGTARSPKNSMRRLETTWM